MATDLRDHKVKDRDTYNNSNTDSSFERIDIEQEQGCCSKLVVLSAIVIFVSFVASSVPNILSGHQPPPHAPLKDSTSASSSPSALLQLNPQYAPPPPAVRAYSHIVDDNNNNNHQDARDAANGAATPGRGNPWARMTAGGQTEADVRIQHGVPTHAGFTQETPSLQHQPSSVSTSAFSYQPPQDHHQQQQHPPKDSQSEQDSAAWPLFQASVWLAYRASLWSARTSYWAARSVVAKPLAVMAALVDTPYTMMKDICLAFLPVYSFFTIAAVIGILVGGSAMWIAQLLISAIGADQETTPTTAVGFSTSKSSAYHASQHQPTRNFSRGQRQPETLARPGSADRSSSPPTIRRVDASRSRSNTATALPSRAPAASMQSTQEGGPRRRREILTDDDYDDDDDDDDDNDWRRV